ncbi:hypothetical protein AYO40_02090 [Planctomycetaceae bacterium SCGC AG-212-D15]|nr:hypothetical protein AYO40_02090 [Planctomycetaceae bacterium SCGC AG-212-D15]
MSAPRRTIIRPVSAPARSDQPRHLPKLRGRLDSERSALARWQRRLRRAFTECEKHQRSVARLEKRIAQIEENNHA